MRKRVETMKSGIINVLKPAGVTSTKVLSQIKYMLKPKKIGHLGTLDPSAVGVLPVCINRATKLFDYYLKKDKRYRAIFVFGKETDTLDSDGIIINEIDCDIQTDQILNVLKDFIGKIKQLPPKYSANKICGKNAYELARNNIDFELKEKEITIHEIKIIEKLNKNTFLFDIKCSAGTYIRSLVRDIAYKLGVFGYMGALIRTESGQFVLENSIRIEDAKEDNIIPFEEIFKNSEKVFVDSKFYDKLINGNTIYVGEKDKLNCLVYCNNSLIGLADLIDNNLKIKIGLMGNND